MQPRFSVPPVHAEGIPSHQVEESPCSTAKAEGRTVGGTVLFTGQQSAQDFLHADVALLPCTANLCEACLEISSNYKRREGRAPKPFSK